MGGGGELPGDYTSSLMHAFGQSIQGCFHLVFDWIVLVLNYIRFKQRYKDTDRSLSLQQSSSTSSLLALAGVVGV